MTPTLSRRSCSSLRLAKALRTSSGRRPAGAWTLSQTRTLAYARQLPAMLRSPCPGAAAAAGRSTLRLRQPSSRRANPSFSARSSTARTARLPASAGVATPPSSSSPAARASALRSPSSPTCASAWPAATSLASAPRARADATSSRSACASSGSSAILVRTVRSSLRMDCCH
jgi:hypothetical protein